MSESVRQLVAAATSPGTGRHRAASQLMTLLQDQPERLPELLASAPALPEPKWIVGITGASGVGKSTLVSALVGRLRSRSPDAPVGIVAVDPASRASGGAILGDRVRMMQHAADADVFIRSLSSRGRMGGLTHGLVAVLSVFRLLGCRYVIVETIGVGQSEMDVSDVVDYVALVLAAGQGDSIQLLKSGVMEIADLVVVNKADRSDAVEFHASVRQHLHVTADQGSRAAREALLVSAADDTGIDEMLDHFDAVATRSVDAWAAKRHQVIDCELHRLVLDQIVARVRQRAEATGAVGAAVGRLRDGSSSLEEVADQSIGMIAACDDGNELSRVREEADA